MSVEHISANESPMGSIEVPIDKSDPDEVAVRVCLDSHSFLRMWVAFKVRKCKN